MFKRPEPPNEGPLPGEDRIRLNQRQSVLDVSSPIQDYEEEPVVEAEMNPFLPDFPQEDFIFLPEYGVLREGSPS